MSSLSFVWSTANLIITLRNDPTSKTEREYRRGSRAAFTTIAKGGSPEQMLRISNQSLTYDAFDAGWEAACKMHIKKNNKEISRK